MFYRFLRLSFSVTFVSFVFTRLHADDYYSFTANDSRGTHKTAKPHHLESYRAHVKIEFEQYLSVFRCRRRRRCLWADRAYLRSLSYSPSSSFYVSPVSHVRPFHSQFAFRAPSCIEARLIVIRIRLAILCWRLMCTRACAPLAFFYDAIAKEPKLPLLIDARSCVWVSVCGLWVCASGFVC